MTILTKKQFLENLDKYLTKIKKSAVFVYPTDTIYGIGCDATNTKAVKKIRSLKKRDSKPFSIIPPSKKWIRENCVITKEVDKWIKKLPGKYTLILNLKSRKCISSEVNNNMDTIGIRLPKHWITQVVAKLKKPLVTTSVNITGNKYMTSIDDINKNIENKIDFIINQGKKNNRPSVIIDLINKKIKKR